MWHSFKSLSTLRLDCPGDVGGGGGGWGLLAPLISKQISYTHTTRAMVSHSPSGQCQGGSNRLGKEEYHLTNVYLPPVSSCPPSYIPELAVLASTTRSMILGDFNAHRSGMAQHAEHRCKSDDSPGSAEGHGRVEQR